MTAQTDRQTDRQTARRGTQIHRAEQGDSACTDHVPQGCSHVPFSVTVIGECRMLVGGNPGRVYVPTGNARECVPQETCTGSGAFGRIIRNRKGRRISNSWLVTRPASVAKPRLDGRAPGVVKGAFPAARQWKDGVPYGRPLESPDNHLRSTVAREHDSLPSCNRTRSPPLAPRLSAASGQKKLMTLDTKQ